jgi:Zn-finger nucleic acid-binding protein
MNYDPAVHSLLCPKCGHGMKEVTWGMHEEITIDRCTHCNGIWFDTNEAQQLKRKPESEVLDEGNPREGRKWDRHVDINCPRCSKKMLKSSDPKQTHIWYEVCVDHGMFMDAGEFTDYKFETLKDRFRDMIRGKRDTTAP